MATAKKPRVFQEAKLRRILETRFEGISWADFIAEYDRPEGSRDRKPAALTVADRRIIQRWHKGKSGDVSALAELLLNSEGQPGVAKITAERRLVKYFTQQQG